MALDPEASAAMGHGTGGIWEKSVTGRLRTGLDELALACARSLTDVGWSSQSLR